MGTASPGRERHHPRGACRLSRYYVTTLGLRLTRAGCATRVANDAGGSLSENRRARRRGFLHACEDPGGPGHPGNTASSRPVSPVPRGDDRKPRGIARPSHHFSRMPSSSMSNCSNSLSKMAIGRTGRKTERDSCRTESATARLATPRFRGRIDPIFSRFNWGMGVNTTLERIAERTIASYEQGKLTTRSRRVLRSMMFSVFMDPAHGWERLSETYRCRTVLHERRSAWAMNRRFEVHGLVRPFGTNTRSRSGGGLVGAKL